MDPTTLRAQLRDDLRRQFRGDLHVNEVSRSLYSTDASLFQIDPLAVAIPLDEADLQTLVRYAFERSIPLIPRGAGTGMAGESLGHGIIVDLSVHFRSIVETGDDWVRVQPGVVLDRLNEHLAKTGRRFAPDPASSHACTIGGMIATDASGSRAALHGYTREYVQRVRVIWDDGTIDEIGGDAASESRTIEIRTGVAELVRTNKELLSATQPKLTFNRCGYRLHELSDGMPDLTRLLVGSEGTLAFTTEACLRTIPLAGGRAAVTFGFGSFDAALQAGLQAREFRPAVCEVLDRRLISLARAQSSGAAAAMPAEVEAALLVEFEGESPKLAADAVRELVNKLQAIHHSALLVIPAYDEVAVADLWSIRSAALPSLYAMGRGRRPLAFVEDMGVAPADLPAFVSRASAILKRFDVSASFLIHVATGQMHLRPFLDPDDPADTARLWPLAEELHSVVLDMGGTVSAQHGTGLARTPWVEKQVGPLFPLFREVKRLFDPRGILNPGKIVGPDPSRPAWPLRKPITSTERNVKPLLVWGDGEMERAIGACNGCGTCRTEDPARRMCPTFRGQHLEAATPRAKANLFRDILNGTFEPTSHEDVRAVADLCVNCKMCVKECPGLADIPKLMLEAKAAHHAAHGLRRSTWFLARIEGLASSASNFALTANFLLRRTSVRWALEKIFGLARRRTLPAFAFRTFLGRARRRGLTRRPEGGPAVAYFVDTFANVFDPAVAEATIAVLRHNGVKVYVPPRQRGTGAAALAQGDADVARERLTYNVRRLADCARAGDTIVCSEPTAALFFRLDALGLTDDPDVRLIAQQTMELTDFLWTLHQQGKLRTDFNTLDMSIGHHVPCHMKALHSSIRSPELLALIPGLRVSKIDVGCSGMAGAYGLNVRNLPTSMAAGNPMFKELANVRHNFGSSECSACRMQMQEGTGKRSLHPVQYLALAYGLMPSVADRLRRPIGRRVSS